MLENFRMTQTNPEITRSARFFSSLLEEVAEMLDNLFDPARTVCAVAAFTGLTRSELRGLK